MISTMKKQLHYFETRFDTALEHFLFHHRFLGFLTIFIGLPLAVLALVYASTAMIMLPLIWIFG